MSRVTMMTAKDVAAVLGISTVRVKQLDHLLTPQRTTSGWRIYQSDVVERVRKERAAKKKMAAASRAP